ncbi:tRNA uridine-5-carboxymethylaminomethyl(34) synthesis GTPase MnmE [Thermostilla marina]
MTYTVDDTIAAISSARGSAGRGLIRICGPRAWEIVRQLYAQSDHNARADAPCCALPPEHPRVWPAVDIVAGELGPVPCHVFYWPQGRSYTGDQTVELHTCGSPVILGSLLEAVFRAGARPAERGEFTFRAFRAGRIDLPQAEAVLGVIEADTKSEMETALRQLSGRAFAPLYALRDRLLDLSAELELGFDFADEHLPFLDADRLRRSLADGITILDDLARAFRDETRTDDTFLVVLTGAPNAGKSSLFNALSKNASAIVANVPGTTRDFLETECREGGVLFRLIDTAGHDEAAADSIAEATGRQLQHLLKTADLIVRCIDGSAPGQAALSISSRKPVVTIVTKADLPAVPVLPEHDLKVSIHQPASLVNLRRLIARRLTESADSSALVPATAARCRKALLEARRALTEALRLADDSPAEELIAAELRVALDQLGEIVGAVYTDELLDRIFSRFCIGK